MRMSAPCGAAALWLAGLSLSMPASAAGPLFEGSASLTGLSYQLIDLDPNDGIAPSITFKSDQGNMFATGLRRMVDTNNQQPSFVGNQYPASDWLMPSGPVHISSTDGLSWASSGPDSLRAGVSVGIQDVQDLPAAFDGSTQRALEVWGDASAGTSLQLPYDDDGHLPDPSYATFVLSAHTALVISGHARAATSVDVANLPWALPSNDETQTPSFFSAAAGIGGAFALTPALSYSDAQFQDAYISAQWTPGSDAAASSERDLSITLRNLQDAAAPGVVLLSAYSILTVATPAVPEASTAAQLLLGLGALLALARRQR